MTSLATLASRSQRDTLLLGLFCVCVSLCLTVPSLNRLLCCFTSPWRRRDLLYRAIVFFAVFISSYTNTPGCRYLKSSSPHPRAEVVTKISFYPISALPFFPPFLFFLVLFIGMRSLYLCVHPKFSSLSLFILPPPPPFFVSFSLSLALTHSLNLSVFLSPSLSPAHSCRY